MPHQLDLCPPLGWSALATCVVCLATGIWTCVIARSEETLGRNERNDLNERGKLFLWSSALSLVILAVVGLASLFIRPVVRFEVAGALGAAALLFAICVGDIYMRGRLHRFWVHSDLLRALTIALITSTGVFGFSALFRQIFMNP